MARDGCHRLKTLRHPNVLKYLDSVELEDKIYMVTEPVVPLRAALDQLNSTTESNTSSTKTQLELSWGLHQLSKAVSFLNNDCKLIHGNLCSSSVFVDKSGEWKLAGMDCVVPVSQTDISITASTLTYNCLPGHEKYRPPEFHKGVGAISNSLNHGNTPWSFDAWGLGCILYESFNGPLERPESLQSIGHIPKSLVPIYRAFLHSDPKSRLNPSRFITDCKLSGGFLDNPFVTACLFLEELNIKDNNEKTEFFKKLPDHIDSFPQNACRYKILPQLLIALEYSIATSSVLTSALKISSHLPPAEYEARVVPCVVKLFASPDRSMRMQLLYQLEQFHDHLKANIVNDQIFPHVANGFVDTSATLREAVSIFFSIAIF